MKRNDICSYKLGSALMASARKLLHNPARIIRPYLSEGMTAMDVGCGMGYFTLPMSDITGKKGKVIAVDIQPEMLTGLQRNAQIARCENITVHQAGHDTLDIKQWIGTVDFALIFMMLHEVPDAERFIREVYDALSPGGKVLFAEPVIHVSGTALKQSVSMIQQAGFDIIGVPRIPICRSVVFQKERVR